MKVLLAIQPSHTITYLAGDANYTHIFFQDGSTQLFARTLSSLVPLLPDFVRIHKTFLVNPWWVTGYQSTGFRKAVIEVGGAWLPVSRRNIRAVKTLFDGYQLKKNTWHRSSTKSPQAQSDRSASS